MKYSRMSIPTGLLLMLLATKAAQATPETGVDYSQTSATMAVNTISTAAPNVLRSRAIVCPDDGFLVATANVLFSFNVNNSNFPGTIAYSISRNSTSFDSDHQHNVFGNYVFDFHVFPATMQRVDTCNAGQSFTYRFLATQGTNVFDVMARQPSLVIVFFRDRL